MKQNIYVGTYSLPIKFGTGQILEGKGKGIYLYEFDTKSFKLNPVNLTEGIDNPSYLDVNGDVTRLYAVNELKEFEGKASGAVSAFEIKSDGSLKLLNKLPTEGTDPCHVIIAPDGERIIVSNFMSGSVSVYPILGDGSLGEIRQHIQYEGSSVNPARQTSPHAHSATFSNDGKYVYVFDLGTDKVHVYRYGDEDYPLSDEGMTDYMTNPGAGPRHAVLGTDGRYCYIINELESTISVLELNEDDGSLKHIQKVSSVKEKKEGNLCADLHIKPGGRFLYGSNRGEDSIVIFRIDEKDGTLSLVGHEPCGGNTPRNFTFDLTGDFLLCANQDSDNIVIFEVNGDTGELEKKIEACVPTPVCVHPVIKR